MPERFPHVSSLKDKQKDAVRHLLQSAGFGKGFIYQPFSTAKGLQFHRNVVVLVVSPLKSITNEQIQGIEELGIPVIVLSTNDASVLQSIAEVNFK